MHLRLISIKSTTNTHRLLEYIFLDRTRPIILLILPHSFIRTTSFSRPRSMSPSPFLLCPNSAATSYLKVGSDLKFYNCLDIHFPLRSPFVSSGSYGEQCQGVGSLLRAAALTGDFTQSSRVGIWEVFSLVHVTHPNSHALATFASAIPPSFKGYDLLHDGAFRYNIFGCGTVYRCYAHQRVARSGAPGNGITLRVDPVEVLRDTLQEAQEASDRLLDLLEHT